MARILIIDDESNIRMMLRLALQHVGHAVETAADGPEGLEKFGPGGPGWDVVLLDQRMPGMEGLEVLREMRRRDPAARVVMITAFGTIDLAEEALDAGAADFLRKPFTVDTLRGAVQAALWDAFARADDAPPAAPDRPRFSRANVNGYHLVPTPDGRAEASGERRCVFSVRDPAGAAHRCTVVLPRYLTEEVKARAHGAQAPAEDHPFWQALCGEILANYLWQHAELPPGGEHHADGLTSGLRRWMDTALPASK